MFQPFDHDANNLRNEWLRGLNHEDAHRAVNASGGTCGHGCSTCDPSAYYLQFMYDKGAWLGGVVCLRGATQIERLIAEDVAAGIHTAKLERIPTAAQRNAMLQDIGW